MDWKEFWDKKAAMDSVFVASGRGYMKAVEFQYSVNEIADRLDLNQDDDLLDLGCGVGLLSLAFSPWVNLVYGVDASGVAIERARETCSYVGNVSFQCMNIEKDLSYLRDEEFDKILVYSVLQYMGSENRVKEFFKWEITKLVSACRILFAGIPDPEKKDLYSEAEQEKDLLDEILWVPKTEMIKIGRETGYKAAIWDLHPMIPQHKYMYNLLLWK